MAEQRQAGLVDHPEVIAHQRQKPFRLPHQISRLTIGDATHPASAAARLPAPAAKKVAHSPNSGATFANSSQALRGPPRRRGAG